MADDLNSRLSKLTPEARARVEKTMKQALERELVTPDLAAARGEFSRGIIFSRSRPRALDEMESVVLPARDMDDATFTKFAERLRSLKESGGESGGR